ncbi:MAG: LysR family transcriptional regulator, partial [Rhizobiales bacterium]|nr:LysR family transcriptional regulator [Hyphomicrobiales bacterium]
MNWDDARMFLAVARTGQLLAASRRLGVKHATLSRRVSALEEALKTRLLIRRTNGCDLTAEGEAFLRAAERMETE